ncbi:MAG: YggT family protein [Gemmatimonadetes bacterium]|nr:YggT family protein [Gemmatimonadota bacterium]
MILIQILRIYLVLIIVRAIMSWFNPDPASPLVRLLTWLTEPVLLPFRRIIPPIPVPKTNVRIDLAPVFVLLIGGWLLTKLRY